MRVLQEFGFICFTCACAPVVIGRISASLSTAVEAAQSSIWALATVNTHVFKPNETEKTCRRLRAGVCNAKEIKRGSDLAKSSEWKNKTTMQGSLTEKKRKSFFVKPKTILHTSGPGCSKPY